MYTCRRDAGLPDMAEGENQHSQESISTFCRRAGILCPQNGIIPPEKKSFNPEREIQPNSKVRLQDFKQTVPAEPSG